MILESFFVLTMTHTANGLFVVCALKHQTARSKIKNIFVKINFMI